jgi:hypothetical protein
MVSDNRKQTPYRIRLTAGEESSLELVNLSSFLYDLVILHDRLLMLFSEEYNYPSYLSFYFYRRSGRPIKKFDRLQVRQVSKESPLTVELLIPAAIGVAAFSWTLIQILEKLADFRNDRAIKGLNRRNLELDVARKEIELRELVERELESVLYRKYSNQTQQVVDAIVKDTIRLDKNGQLAIEKVEVLETTEDQRK